jgi:hypothetical protein
MGRGKDYVLQTLVFESLRYLVELYHLLISKIIQIPRNLNLL